MHNFLAELLLCESFKTYLHVPHLVGLPVPIFRLPVFRDIVSPHKTIRGMNRSIPSDEIDRYRVSPLKLKLDIVGRPCISLFQRTTV